MAMPVENLDAAIKLHDAGKLVEAERLYRLVLQADPRQSRAWHNLGMIARDCRQLEAAIELMSRAIVLDGAQPMYHNNLGGVLQLQSRSADAAASYRRAIALAPDFAEAYCNLGSACKDLGRTAEAIEHYVRSIELNPNLAEAHFNLGVIRQSEGQYDEAIRCYENATRLKRGYWQALNNLGTVYKLQGQFSEAMACYQSALSCDGDVAEAHRNRALLRLMLGDYEQGWPEYEWRWRVRGAPRVDFAQPRWDGQPMPGKTLLLRAEQGLGDAIQFVRYAPLARERSGARVLLQCPSSLRELLKDIEGVDRLVVDPGEEPFDCYVPLLSVPAVFSTRVDTVPAKIPYLFAQPQRVARWRAELASYSGLKIGIAWQGNPGYAADAQRSVPLASLAPLAACPGVQLFSLQKCHGCEQLAPLAEKLRIVDLGPSLDIDAPFVDTAAVMMNLDLVVTSDTAIAHLAGALGVKVWVALPWVADWRWLTERRDSPWYPTMRLFRQTRMGQWSEVFNRISNEVKHVGGS
jgi:tetratricopeptide (TPR) repeat protein